MKLKRKTNHRTLLRQLSVLLLLLTVAVSCQRRDLFVYGDEFFSVILNVDWRDYTDVDPDGMTVWFYPLEETTRAGADTYINTRAPYRTTSANVRQQNLYLPNGNYQGVVINYSPDEFGRQAFYDMDNVHLARVEATPSSYQPDEVRTVGNFITDSVDAQVKRSLFSDSAWNDRHRLRPTQRESGYYTVMNQPEAMGADTIDNRGINSGTEFDDYIPWKKSEEYQKSITVRSIDAVPHSLIWNMRIRVFIKKGFDYLWQTRATLAGLSNGHYLPRHINTEDCALISLDSWTTQRKNKDQGWVICNFTCFGLRPSTIKDSSKLHPTTSKGKSRYDGKECDIEAYYSDVCDRDELRLNLAFILRDQKTVKFYHYNVGNSVISFGDQLVLNVDVDPSINGGDDIELPEVDAYEGADFGADVTPWKEEDPVDVPM